MLRNFVELWVGAGIMLVALLVLIISSLAGWGWLGPADVCVVVYDPATNAPYEASDPAAPSLPDPLQTKLTEEEREAVFVASQEGPTLAALRPHDCYCEAYDLQEAIDRAPGVRQPFNTWSNLVPMLAGLGLLLWVGLRRAGGSLPAYGDSVRFGRMGSDTFYPGLFGTIIAFMGPGSMFFHASVTWWGGVLDQMSIWLFTDFLTTYWLTTRLLDRRHGLAPWLRYGGVEYVMFPLIFVVQLGLKLALLLAVPSISLSGGAAYLVMVPGLLYGTAEIVAVGFSYSRRKVRGTDAFFWIGLGSLGLAFVFWGLSYSAGDPLCSAGSGGAFHEEGSALHAHALWHVFANVTAVMLFLHYTYSEDRSPWRA